MKKSLLFSLMLGGVSMGLHAQYTILQDLTSKLQNADFSAGSPVETTVYTYDYNMTDAGAGADGADLFGQQAVTGWTAVNLSDNIKVMQSSSDPARTDGANARAAGIFAYGDEETGETSAGLGGTYYAPDADAEEGISGQSLGMVAVWGAAVKYTQDVTLPAGGYMLIVKAQNTAGASEMIPSYNGFVAENGTEYLSSKTTWTVGQWETDTIFIRVKAETSGKIQLGYKSGNYGSGGAAHIFIDNVKLYSIDPAPLDQIEIDAAKEDLLALIEAGEDMGVDVTAAQAVYDNPSATLAQVQSAIEKQKELNAAAQTDLSAYFIKNPHFTEDTPLAEDNGICTYDYDMVDPNGSNGRKVDYYGMLPVEGWVSSNPEQNARACGVFKLGSNSFLGGAAFLPPTTLSDGSTEGNVLGFVGVWTANSQYTQHVTLPKGKYTLEISYYNAGGTTAIAKNLMGFIADDGTEYLGTTTTFAVGKWLKETIKFEFTEPTSGDFTMGYTAANVGSGGMPHFFIDGIAIYFVGQLENPSLLGLESTVEVAQGALDVDFYTGLHKELQDAVDAANALIDANSSDEEANIAAADAINALMPAVKANIAAYEKLTAWSDEGGALPETMAKYEGVKSLYARLEKLGDDVMDALENYNWTTAQIEETIASLDTIVKEEIQKVWEAAVASGEALDEDLDITPLFDQMAYTYSTSEQKGANVPDKEWQYGDASNFKTQYGTAEVWYQSPFTVSRTLKDMPAGKYTITTKAFFRNADNATNYDAYVEGAESEASLFAGHAKEGLTNVAAIASNDAIEGWTQIGETGVYIPNNQQTAHDVFENEDYTGAVQKSVSIVLADTGDLTFGITATEMQSDSWVVWYSFSIAYNAADDDLYDEELIALVEEASTLMETGCGDVQKALSNLEEAIGAGESALEGATEDKVEAIKSLNAAIDYASQSEGLVEKLVNLRAIYESQIDSLENSDIIMGYFDKIDEGYDSNEQVQGYIDGMPAAWIASVFDGKDLSAATEEAPIDVTTAILNPDFETGDLTGWTRNEKATGDTGVKESGEEGTTYYISNVHGIYLFNTWNSSAPDGGFYVSQTLPGLPAGKYKLEALLASDLGNKVALNGTEFTMENEKTTAAEASVVFNVFEPQDVEVKVSSATWFKTDYFRLSYIGAAKISVQDIANLIDRYLDGDKEVTVQTITDLIDQYLAQ